MFASLTNVDGLRNARGLFSGDESDGDRGWEYGSVGQLWIANVSIRPRSLLRDRLRLKRSVRLVLYSTVRSGPACKEGACNDKAGR